MDDNGRHKPDPYRWMMPPHHAMKDHPTAQTIKLMTLLAERDTALHERDLALSEKKTALAERDMAIFQRDAAISERDDAIAALEYLRSSSHSPKKEPMPKKKKSAGGDLAGPTKKKQRKEWRVEELGGGLNEVTFDESTMPVPVCSCTGKYQPCYKWGNGGWQSACCTTTLSVYPLPVMPNKRHARVNGRKMSGSVFNKLLSRLASEGHDLGVPIDMKDHWSKHGTNRYITIK